MASIIEGIRNTLGENLGGIGHKLGTVQFGLDEVPDLSGKVALVTGGSEGIGFGCTYTLLKHNISKLFILSPRKEVFDGAKEVYAKELGEEKANRAHHIQCDLADWNQVYEVAEQVKKSTDRLDILINNAGRGIMTYQLSPQGVDLHFAINHCGHVILTSHLMPLLSKTSSPTNTVRVCQLGSNAHQGAPKDVKFESLDEMNQDLGANGQYGRSKLANILYMRWCARHITSKNPHLLFNVSHPGVVSTKQSTQDIHEPFPLLGYGVSTILEPFKKDQFEGACSTMFGATVTNESGQYICPPAVIEKGTDQSNSVELQEQLMRFTTALIGEKTKKESRDKGCPFDLTKV